MNYTKKGNRIYINVDESTHLEYDIDDLKDKIGKIPVSYMSSLEKDDLIKQLKDEKLI